MISKGASIVEFLNPFPTKILRQSSCNKMQIWLIDECSKQIGAVKRFHWVMSKMISYRNVQTTNTKATTSVPFFVGPSRTGQGNFFELLVNVQQVEMIRHWGTRTSINLSTHGTKGSSPTSGKALSTWNTELRQYCSIPTIHLQAWRAILQRILILEGFGSPWRYLDAQSPSPIPFGQYW